MLYTPHALTGATIAYLIPNPAVAIPLSVVSHLFFDVVPHSNPNPIKAKGAKKALIITEVILGNIILIAFSYIFSENNPYLFMLMFTCGIFANLPDILTGPYAIFKKDFLYSKKISEFQKLIQNHVKGIYGYTFQIAFIIIIAFFFLNKLGMTS